MKRIILILLTILFTGFVNVSAKEISSFDIDHLKIELLHQKDQNRILNNIPIKITALTKENKIVTDYDGTVLIFSESDKYAIYGSELKENAYTFNSVDRGIKIFNPGVKFSKQGLQDIYVYDLGDETDSVMGKTTIHIQGSHIYEKIDKKILQLTGKIKKKPISQQIKIYKNFITKIDKVLNIKKYSKYRKILLYIRNKIQIKFREVQYSTLNKGE